MPPLYPNIEPYDHGILDVGDGPAVENDRGLAAWISARFPIGDVANNSIAPSIAYFLFSAHTRWCPATHYMHIHSFFMYV
jgi:hypothetical protein